MNNPFARTKLVKSVHSAKYYFSQGLRKVFTLTIIINNIYLQRK